MNRHRTAHHVSHKGDLENALQGDFDFKGNFAFATPLPQAPNPGLHIEGLGLIGLPLSERDAKLVIGIAAQAPFGRGERTVIDTEVRDTFEVEPARVTFQNPTWDVFVKELVSKSVWPELGVGTYKTPPRCELYKLLMYQTGSQSVHLSSTIDHLSSRLQLLTSSRVSLCILCSIRLTLLSFVAPKRRKECSQLSL